MKKALIFLLICNMVYAQTGYKFQESFSAGELSWMILSREKLTKFHDGASVMENLIPLPQGPATKRPGTKYVAGSKSNTKIRLFPFLYSADDTVIIEAGNQYFRYFADNAAVLDSVGTETLTAVDGGNLVAHWLLDDTEASTAINDDNPGTLDGTSSTTTAALNATGKVNDCFDLDGQYNVYMADAAVLSFTDNTDDEAFSLVCWAYVAEQAGTQVLMSKWDETTGAAAMEYKLQLDSDRNLELHLADVSADLTGDLVAQWYLNDIAGDTHCDDVTTNHDGVIDDGEFASTLTATGKAAMTPCYDFDGQYNVEVADHVNLSFGDASDDSAFSISAWVYVTDTGDTQNILSKYDAGVGVEWRLYLSSSEEMYLRVYDNDTSNYEGRRTRDGITAGWHHVVAKYDGSGGTSAEGGIDLYVDGENVVERGASTGSYDSMHNTATQVIIGARYSGGVVGQYWADKMDNVILFDAEITAATISALYNEGAGREVLTSGAAEISAKSDDAIGIGWHLFASTYSAPDNGTATAANSIILYVDGAAADITATNNADYGAMQDGAGLFRIGAQESIGGAAERFWNDKIDEVSIFKDVLTPTEVASLYSTTEYEIETPYLTADLFEIQYKQSADVLILDHPDYETRLLSRFGDTLWTLTELGLSDGPFRSENRDETLFITPSATTGSITLTASGTGNTPFYTGTTAGHQPSGSLATSKSLTGALFKLVQTLDVGAYEEVLSNNYTADQTEDVSWMDCGSIGKGVEWYLTNGSTNWTGTLEVQRNYTIGAAHGAATWENVHTFQSNDDRNVVTDGEETEAEADYRVILTASGDAAEPCQVYFRISDTDHTGIVEITSVTSPTVAIGTVVTTLADTSATHRWSEGAWSNYRGWPRTVTFFEDRLTFGGNASQPDTIWTSVSGEYFDFLAGPDDADALIFTLSSRQVNVIEWIIGKEKLLIGTSGAEWSLSGEADEALTPSSFIAKEHSNFGSASLQAMLAGNSVLFFQRGAEKMRELAYDWENDSYVAPDMTILAESVTGNGITNLDMQKIPNSIIWCIRDDGEIALFIYDRKELITSWSRLITDGEFESVAVVTGDPEDQVWVSVKRTMAGVNSGDPVRYIEYFSDRYFGTDVDDAYYVDSGITYDSNATTTITGLSHLNAESVAVLGDGVVQASKTVSGGSITITSAATVQAGLPFTVQLKTMPLSYPSQGGTILGRKKRIITVNPQYYNSGDFSVGRSSSDLESLEITSMDSSHLDMEHDDRLTFPAGWDRYAFILFYQQSPEPLTLLSYLAEFEVN